MFLYNVTLVVCLSLFIGMIAARETKDHLWHLPVEDDNVIFRSRAGLSTCCDRRSVGNLELGLLSSPQIRSLRLETLPSMASIDESESGRSSPCIGDPCMFSKRIRKSKGMQYDTGRASDG